MKELQLTNYKEPALVDDDVFEVVRQHSWQACLAKGGVWVATASFDGYLVYLHEYVLGVPRYTDIAFEDGNPLNCQRANLAVVGE